MFEWIMDEDGDIGLCVLGLITFVKYKDYAVIVLGRLPEYRRALKYLTIVN